MEMETREKMLAINSEVEIPLAYGYERWQDEKEYEDINDYATLFKDKVEKHGGKFLKMTKRPFGFKALIGGLTFQFYANSKYIGVKASI